MRVKRRSLAIFVAAASVATLAACTGSVGGSSSSSTQSSSQSSPAPALANNSNQGSQAASGDAADISTPPATCAVLAWNGKEKSTRNFAYSVGPGVDFSYRSDLDLFFVPGCGTSDRDYIIGSGLGKNAIGETIGDRQMPAPLDGPAYTKDGVPVYVTLRLDFNLDQSQPGMKEFWVDMCSKFSCALRVEDPANPPDMGASSSTKGWNRMLGELVGPTLDNLVSDFMPQFSSAIIQNQGTKAQLAQVMSQAFTNYLSQFLGNDVPLLCGPGNSYPTAGGGYHCALVRIRIGSVIPASELDFGKYGNSARNVAAYEAVLAACHADHLPNCPAIVKSELALGA